MRLNSEKPAEGGNESAAHIQPHTNESGAGDARLVVVANRLPVRQVEDAGRTCWKRSPGGLVSALAPVLEEREGGWIGWSGQVDEAFDPFRHDGIALNAVALSSEELEHYYYGFSNTTLWPLYHDAVRAPRFSRSWWDAYRTVNQRFADAAADFAPHGSTVWVQDYHLQLLPSLLRALRPDLLIGFFLHIPFPPVELFARMPWRSEIVRGLLGADLLGFHTVRDACNAAEAAARFGGAAVECHPDESTCSVSIDERLVQFGAFPISIDVRLFECTALRPDVRARATRLKRNFGDRIVMLGVDRLDYTKGIVERFEAFRSLLDQGRLEAEDCVLVQIVVPSRERVDEYADLRCEIERLVGEINGRHSLPGQPALHYVYRSLPLEKLVAHYLAADVMVVTSLRDGMNLVAKEYIASRTADDGVLILSEFAGAARELREAMIVNPFDSDGLEQAMAEAVRMPITAQQVAVQAMRARLRRHDVYRWAARFLRRLDRVGATAPARTMKIGHRRDLRPGRDHHAPALPSAPFDPATMPAKGVG